MSDFLPWLGFLLLVFAGAAAVRFNPAVTYSRTTLVRLAFAAVLAIGVTLMLGFFYPPAPTRSGVFNIDGG